MGKSGEESVLKIPSGIEGFDEISLGGFPKGRMTLLSGSPGSGKTIFSIQFLRGGIEQSKEAGIFITFEETPKDIIKNVQGFGWDIKEWEDMGLWRFIDLSNLLHEEYIISGNYDLNGLILRIKHKIKEINAKRIVMDSITALLMRFPNLEIIRRELIRLTHQLNSSSITSLITAERYEDENTISRCHLEDFVSDNVILLKNAIDGEKRRRTIEILKFRGTTHHRGQYSFTIQPNKGVVVITFLREPLSYEFRQERMQSGIHQLDEMLGGGYYLGSNILISGSTGTGKTILSISMIEKALNSGKKCMLINFEESRERILCKARMLNLDLEKEEKEGRCILFNIYPESESIENHLVKIQDLITMFNPDILLIDSLSALERISDVRIFRESLIHLLLVTRARNITGLYLTTSFNSKDLFSLVKQHVSTLADTIILLRMFETDGGLKRGMVILKMRDSDHEKRIREYIITSQGIQFKEPINQTIGFLGKKDQIL